MTGHAARERDRTTATGVAVRMVLAWVDCYTGWVSAEAAERRREEIHSDLWEQQADARANGAPRLTATLSIARRAAAGAPADLLWVHTQRAASRGLPAEQKARSMNNTVRLLSRWWWVLGAAVVSAWGLAMSTGQLLQPGMPYLEGTIQGFVTALLLASGVVLRARMPRTAGVLVVAGGSMYAILWWAPLVMAVAIAVVVGAAVEVLRSVPRPDVGRITLAASGLLAVGITPIGYVMVGYDAGAIGLTWFAAAAAGTALVWASSRTAPLSTGPATA